MRECDAPLALELPSATRPMCRGTVQTRTHGAEGGMAQSARSSQRGVMVECPNSLVTPCTMSNCMAPIKLSVKLSVDLLGGARGDGRDGILHERRFRVMTMQRSVRGGTIMSRCDDPRHGQHDAWWVMFDDTDHPVKQDLVPKLRLGRTDVLTRVGHWATDDDDPSGEHWDGREICKICFCPSNEETCPVCKTAPKKVQQMLTRSATGSSSSSNGKKRS